MYGTVFCEISAPADFSSTVLPANRQNRQAKRHAESHGNYQHASIIRCDQGQIKFNNQGAHEAPLLICDRT